MYKKIYDFFFIIYNFLCKFSKCFSNFKLIFSLLFFGELPTIADHRITQIYSRQIPLKLKLYMVNQYVGLLKENHEKVGLF